MNKISRLLSAFGLILLVFGFSACQKEWKPDRNTIKIENDKPIQQAVFFDESMADVEKQELFEKISEHLTEYNNQYGSDSVVISKPKADANFKDIKNIIIDYISMKDFGRFNNYSVFDGAVNKAGESGFDTSQSYYAVSKGNVDKSALLQLNDIQLGDDYRVLILDVAMQPHSKSVDSTDLAEDGSADDKKTDGNDTKDIREALNYVELKGSEVLYVTENIIVDSENTVSMQPDSMEFGYVIYK